MADARSHDLAGSTRPRLTGSQTIDTEVGVGSRRQYRNITLKGVVAGGYCSMFKYYRELFGLTTSA